MGAYPHTCLLLSVCPYLGAAPAEGLLELALALSRSPEVPCSAAPPRAARALLGGGWLLLLHPSWSALQLELCELLMLLQRLAIHILST